MSELIIAHEPALNQSRLYHVIACMGKAMSNGPGQSHFSQDYHFLPFYLPMCILVHNSLLEGKCCVKCQGCMSYVLLS